MRISTRHDVATSHGRIATEVQGSGFPIVFIHGNSACRRVFQNQFSSGLLDGYKLVAPDLPGHGESENAHDPGRSYILPGLAGMMLELLDQLNIKRAVVVGASLGGHVAIEMLARSAVPGGLFLMGSPPVGLDIAQGFNGKPLNGLASKGELTPQEAAYFASAVFGSRVEPFMRQAIERTDAVFRPTLFGEAGRAAGVNQRETVASAAVPTAIVNGADDRIINLDYVDSVPYARLWRGECLRIAGASHSAFWETPEVINRLLREFTQDVIEGRA